jgi:microcystin degradation protein MlrC
MRVGIVGLQHESNTFLARPTTLADFESDLLHRGEEVRKLESSHHEIGGFFSGLRGEGVEAVPIFTARAIPSGAVTSDAFNSLFAILEEELDRAGQLDGLLVAPHGAMVCENADDADGIWLSRLRRRFGQEFPIIGTLDPHANLSQLMIKSTNALIAYRTNPHVDQHECGVEAARLMARTLRDEVAPTQAALFPPMIINIERQCTNESPCRDQLEAGERWLSLRELGDSSLDVLSTSLMLGFPYADVRKMGSAVVVVTNNNRHYALGTADCLGKSLWENREHFIGRLMDISAAIEFACTHDGPIGLLDMGDNVGGGSPGDGTLLAHALRGANVGPSFVCLYDPASVIAAAGAGHEIELSVGGKTDERHGQPLTARFTVERVFDGRFDEPDVRHGGWQSFDMGRSAVVRTENLTVLLTSKRTPPFSLRQITAAGLDPAAFRVLVAKGVHAPVAAYAPVCKHMVRVNTPGITSADLTQFDFRHRRRPMFPFEAETTWD